MNDITIMWTTESPKPETHFHNTRSRNKGRLMIIKNLPAELVVYDILTRVSADSWEKTLKHICKAWSAIPRDPKFINLHLHHCKLGLYIQDLRCRNYGTQFIEIEDKKAKVAFRRSIPGEVCDGHDGLLLIRRLNEHGNENYYFANPATKQVVKLVLDFQQNVHYFSYLAKIVSTNEKLKVIFFARGASEGRLHYYWYIYAIESGMHMPYRKVSCPDSIEIKEPFYPSNTISIGAVTYWNNEYDGQTLALDVNDETFHSLLLPEDTKNANDGRQWQLVKNGDRLGFISWTDKAREINMWILKDLQNNKWIKTSNIVADRSSSIMDRGSILSATFLYDQQILIFVVCGVPHSSSSRLVAFDVRTGSIRTMRELHMFPKVGLHINSLVAL